MDFDIIFDVIDTFSVRALNLQNLHKPLFSMDLHVFTIQKNRFSCFSSSFSLPVWALIFDEFWYRSWLQYREKRIPKTYHEIGAIKICKSRYVNLMSRSAQAKPQWYR
jgi:hypothetical protein